MVYISVFTCSNLFSKARGLSCAANTDTSHLLRMPDVCVGGKQTVYYGSPTLNVFKKHIFKWICSRTFRSYHNMPMSCKNLLTVQTSLTFLKFEFKQMSVLSQSKPFVETQWQVRVWWV